MIEKFLRASFVSDVYSKNTAFFVRDEGVVAAREPIVWQFGFFHKKVNCYCRINVLNVRNYSVGSIYL